MRRLLLLALLALAVFAVPAVAAACTDTDDGAVVTAASSTGDGGVTAGPAGTDGGTSGGTPATWDGETPDATVGDASALSGDATSGSAGEPEAVVAQEPTPEPEGPGQEQPGEPGAEPPPIDVPEAPPVAEAPAGETGGGLPRTGIEALQLALLGIVLLLVGARLRVLALRRRRRAPEPRWDGRESGARRDHPAPAYEEDFADPAPSRHLAERDEWSFPDPSEPAPTGLLPSTASARRQARALAMSGDRD